MPKHRSHENCPKCQNKLKRVIKPHQIKTRDERRPVVNIENLPIMECTVCTYSELPESSEDIIKVVKDMVKVEMERMAKVELASIQSKQNNSLTTIFKRLIG